MKKGQKKLPVQLYLKFTDTYFEGGGRRKNKFIIMAHTTRPTHSPIYDPLVTLLVRLQFIALSITIIVNNTNTHFYSTRSGKDWVIGLLRVPHFTVPCKSSIQSINQNPYSAPSRSLLRGTPDL